MTDSDTLVFTGTNLGIGTSSPFTTLSVAGSGYFAGTLTASSLIATTSITIPPTSTSTGQTLGVIYLNNTPFIHTYSDSEDGTENLFIGYSAGNFTTSGTGQNIGIGRDALSSNTTGSYNTALGYRRPLLQHHRLQQHRRRQQRPLAPTPPATTTPPWATQRPLRSNTTGYNNTAIGYSALFSNTTGYNNTAIGYSALSSNTTGYYNTALGSALSPTPPAPNTA
ncbi:MAG: hypothetical protein KatS3mg099_449 [Candidatus Parcubacteria bacterium]|nr:MAG: hypothetical protein KatS3mg099_449 [Candidatus Parcubacteria bacterium]